MCDAALQRIQELQFSDPDEAASRLLPLLREIFLLDIRNVEIRPLAVSLNSINGTLTQANGQRLFFKTHVEPDSAISEYYQAEALSQAGWPVIRPLHSSTAWGRQLLLYELVEDPTVFDLAWRIETGDGKQYESLQGAQHKSDDELLDLYLRSLAWQAAEEAGAAAIHQLFWHRLTGARMSRFYGDAAAFDLPHGQFSQSEVWQARWTINGQRYEESLAALVKLASVRIRPARPGPSIVGHGDAHNGNVFLRGGGQGMVYFDPAFAGRHHPLLDLAKPLFHNVFAMWMYFPQEKSAVTDVRARIAADGRWHVEHNFALPALRWMFFSSKLERVLLPLLRELAERGWLEPDWRHQLKLALFCCPLLTMNLADSSRFPPAISLLGLSQAVEMGAESRGQRSLLDQALDGIEAQL
ncbi:MAG: hypothetical protein OXB89_11805 [Anaerolineaceae bacterium]|nr:hypothetical protein [Anaerolineaceae bacterium]